MTEPYGMNGLLLAYADLLYNDQADADAAEQAFNSTHGPFLERITAAMDIRSWIVFAKSSPRTAAWSKIPKARGSWIEQQFLTPGATQHCH